MRLLNPAVIGLSALCLLDACIDVVERPEESPITLHVLNGDSTFTGDPLKFWVTLQDPLTDREMIVWERGYGSIYKRSHSGGDDSLFSDTAYIEWRVKPANRQESEDKKTYRYLDTVSVKLGNLQSEKYAVTIENIFPNLDSVLVNGLSQRLVKDTVFMAIHRGAEIKVSLHFTDFLKETPLDVVWPGFLTGVNRLPYTGLNTAVFEFPKAPTNVEHDNIGKMEVIDGDGASQNWQLRFRTFQEKGSIWVGTPFEVIKLSSAGFEIFRLMRTSNSSVLMTLNRDELYLLDEYTRRIQKFNTLTFKESRPFSMAARFAPHAMATGEKYLWVAQNDTRTKADSSLILALSYDDGKPVGDTLAASKGRILSMVPNPDLHQGMWYINSNEDNIFLAMDTGIVLDVIINGLTNPKLLSYDAEDRQLWVASETALFILSKNGNLLGEINNFGRISSISAGNGVCWVVDDLNDRLYKLLSDVTKIRPVSQLKSNELSIPFQHPVSVSIIRQEKPGCWVADEGAGSVVKLDGLGEEQARFSGMTSPKTLLINQVY